jgi:hypothetical protein
MEQESLIIANPASIIKKSRVLKSLLASPHFLKEDTKVCLFCVDPGDFKNTEELKSCILGNIFIEYGRTNQSYKEALLNGLTTFVVSITDWSVCTNKPRLCLITFPYKGSMCSMDISDSVQLQKFRLYYIKMYEIFDQDMEPAADKETITKACIAHINNNHNVFNWG